MPYTKIRHYSSTTKLQISYWTQYITGKYFNLIENQNSKHLTPPWLRAKMDKYTDMDFKISIITNKSTENILSYPELINQCAHSYFYHQYTQTIRYNFLSHPSILGIALPARKQPFIIGIITGYNIIISMFPYFYLFSWSELTLYNTIMRGRNASHIVFFLVFFCLHVVLHR